MQRIFLALCYFCRMRNVFVDEGAFIAPGVSPENASAEVAETPHR